MDQDQRVVLYSTGCPKCAVLKKKLDQAGIVYVEVTDMEEMKAVGLKAAPALKVGGELMAFGEAVKWANDRRA